MLDHLAPARRRLLLGVVALAVVLAGLGAAVALLGRDGPVVPVAQDRPGPVLLLPGYGGATGGLVDLEAALRARGREVEVVAPPGDGRGDLREHAALVAQRAEDLVDAGAPSVDLVGYSAGGVVARLVVAEDGGGSFVRRVLTLASPHHGTDLAAQASGLGSQTCPEACRQLAPGSDLLTSLNRDETPPGPTWLALWTTDDEVVVPPTSGDLDGAVAFALQDVCPDRGGDPVEHGEVPSDPAVVALVVEALGTAPLAVPGPSVCAGAA